MEQELWVTFVWCAVGYRCDSCAWSAYYMPGHEPSLKHRIPHLARQAYTAGSHTSPPWDLVSSSVDVCAMSLGLPSLSII